MGEKQLGREGLHSIYVKIKYIGFFYRERNITGNSKNETGRINLARNKTARGLSSPEGG